MKFLSIVLSIFAFSSEIQCQNLDSIDLNSFVVLYTTGAHWDEEKPAQDQAYFKEHSAHLSALRKSKRITIGGRYGATGRLF